MKNYISAFILLSAVPVSVQAAATAGSSSASDIDIETAISGTLVIVPVGPLQLTAGPVNEVQGSAPGIYNTTVAVPATTGSATAGIVSLALEADVDAINVASNVDGAEGPRAASGSISTASAEASLDVTGLGLGLVSLGLTTTSAVQSNSLVTWDGTTFTTSGTSNYLTSGGDLTLSILGVDITIPTLVANVPVNIPVDVDVGLISILGSITLTVDAISTSIVGDTATASAASVLFSTDLTVTALGGTNLSVETEIALNQTSASLTAVPVPEPGVSTGVMLAAVGLLMRRGRRRPAAA